MMEVIRFDEFLSEAYNIEARGRRHLTYYLNFDIGAFIEVSISSKIPSNVKMHLSPLECFIS